MRAPTPFVVFLVGVVAHACVEVPPAPALTPPPPSFDCVPVERAVIGAWQRVGATEELREDGAFFRDGVEGAFRFRAPGRVALDFGGTHHEELIGLVSVNEMISADESGIGHAWSRTSISPPIPAACYAVRTSVVGTWNGGPEVQTVEADGRYAAGERTGTWHMPSNGHLTIHTTETGDVAYYFAQLSDTTAMLLPIGEAQQASLLARAD